MWTEIPKLNVHHKKFAVDPRWGTLMFTDFYIMLVASGTISDLRFIWHKRIPLVLARFHGRAEVLIPSAAPEIERHSYDVVVIGAGGLGSARGHRGRQRGLRVAVVTKSLFGKAHTVMAEGGCAAAVMGNANPQDSWQVHFADTMRGGKFSTTGGWPSCIAQEAPDRVWELETYGAPFDRTKDGRISQRNFGGHTGPRLAPRRRPHRPGDHPHPAAEDRLAAAGGQGRTGDYEARIKVFHECSITDLIPDRTVTGSRERLRLLARDRQFILFEAPAVVLATGGIGKSFKVSSNSVGVHRRRHARRCGAGSA